MPKLPTAGRKPTNKAEPFSKEEGEPRKNPARLGNAVDKTLGSVRRSRVAGKRPHEEKRGRVTEPSQSNRVVESPHRSDRYGS